MREIYVVTPRGYRWPFSKGLIIESLINAGLGVEAANAVAHTLEERLKQRRKAEITTGALKRMLLQEVRRTGNAQIAKRLARQTQSFEEILVRDEQGVRPFSKGLLVRSLEEAGFALREAYELAKAVEQRLRRAGVRSLTGEELEAVVGDEVARRYGAAARERYRERLALAGEVFVAEPGGEPRMPFSKGILAQSIMSVGLGPEQAYRIAREVERSLVESGRVVIDRNALRERVAEILQEEAGEEVATRYLMLRAVRRLERPVHILIGGVSGVGKSVLASALAYRLGITRMISTDAVREILRATVPQPLVPTLHTSTFDAWCALAGVESAKEASPSDEQVLQGFRDQVSRVAVGIRAIQERSAREHTSLVIEGVHVVPGFLAHPAQAEVIQVPMLVVVEDEEVHRGRFKLRDTETQGRRSVERYLKHFHWIRLIQDYLLELAVTANIPVIPGENLDKAIEKCIEVITDKFQEVYRIGELGGAR
ncbi:ATP cone domain-containing protein [Marinithermus hydrothermalis]|uniref:ATP-cone domain protein n=1 Tax=Marinithermus hydrothermalis (strain DSM 14884 / JCM 11576 / T1) TaxID=869210 RepID=F2NPF3_MARHT|nr:ATP cone domain-containing protein [Marinithermus hydrothermalis]AEB12234.1 ATP-cone domain protein [Marinithermus hydrothermalis DSM 14884]